MIVKNAVYINFTRLNFNFLLRIRKKRPELKLIISSATLEAQPLVTFFTEEESGFTTKIIKVEGRMYPVKVHYLENPCKNYVTAAANLALEIHESKPDGDILIFLTGQEEIQSCAEFI